MWFVLELQAVQGEDTQVTKVSPGNKLYVVHVNENGVFEVTYSVGAPSAAEARRAITDALPRGCKVTRVVLDTSPDADAHLPGPLDNADGNRV